MGNFQLHVVGDDSPRSDVITQNDLNQLLELRTRAAAAVYECSRFEQSIIERLNAGELVERGGHAAVVVHTTTQEVTEDVIRSVHGLEALESLRLRVPPVTARSLKVFPSVIVRRA